MKKLLLAVFITAFSLLSATAQESIGFTAGYSSLNTSYGLSFGSESDSPTKSGFFIGFFKEFELSEKYDLKTELSLGMYNKDGEKTNVLLLPVLLKYNVTNGLALLFGPQLDYVLDTQNNDTLNK
ncbi:porin family protein [Flavicella sediminum]|uniref:outer membrane beta-barrel protein n=1 Tax=Flavicella sediminum TaxID=2585141 RepID=UPI00111F44D3|nr:outer membrane beta-barrel protein [Flavicella sediminum]